MRTTGTVKWFDPGKGEGCVVSEGGALAALSREMLATRGLKTVAAGTPLTCEVKLTDKGLAVTAIYEIENEAPPQETPQVRGDPQSEDTYRNDVTWKRDGFDLASGCQ